MRIFSQICWVLKWSGTQAKCLSNSPHASISILEACREVLSNKNIEMNGVRLKAHVEQHMRTFSRHFLTRLNSAPFMYLKSASYLTGDTLIRKISIAAFENIPNISVRSFLWGKWRSDRWLVYGGAPHIQVPVPQDILFLKRHRNSAVAAR